MDLAPDSLCTYSNSLSQSALTSFSSPLGKCLFYLQIHPSSLSVFCSRSKCFDQTPELTHFLAKVDQQHLIFFSDEPILCEVLKVLGYISEMERNISILNWTSSMCILSRTSGR